MTPIAIKLFECLGLNPVPVLPFIILNINIAGLTTLIGHPPNLLITGNSYISKQNITFLTFTMHTCFGVLVALIQTNCHLRIQHRNIYKILAPHSQASGEELGMWQKCLNSIKNIGNNNDKLDALKMVVLQKIESLENMTTTFTSFAQSENDGGSFQATLCQLKKTVSE